MTINLLDLIVAGFVLFYLVKNAGGIGKTVRNLLIILAVLIVLGLISRLLLDAPLAQPLHKTLKESYFVKLSYSLIKGLYPTVEQNAPKVDKFIKDKIMTAPTPELAIPKNIIPEKALPKVNLQELMPELK